MDELESLRADFEKHVTQDEGNFAEIREMLVEISGKLDPILDVYRSVILSKGFITGLAGVIVAIGAIVAAFVWLINSAIQK